MTLRKTHKNRKKAPKEPVATGKAYAVATGKAYAFGRGPAPRPRPAHKSVQEWAEHEAALARLKGRAFSIVKETEDDDGPMAHADGLINLLIDNMSTISWDERDGSWDVNAREIIDAIRTQLQGVHALELMREMAVLIEILDDQCERTK